MTKHLSTIGLLGVFLSTLAAASAESDTFDCSNGNRDVGALSRQQPYYPHSALLFCISGEVKAQFTINDQGRPENIRIVESKPEGIFDRATTEAIKQWRFTPACREGELADREAIQTIEFRLPGEFREDCAETAEQIDEATARLLGDIGARYALLAQYWQNGGDWSEIQTTITAPFSSFKGDLKRVAEFHRRALESISPGGHGNDINALYSSLFSSLQPHVLRQNGALEKAREILDRYRLAVDDRVEETRKSYDTLTSDYRRLERETDLDESVLELLVVPFVGNPEIPFEEVVEPTRRVLDHFESIVDFLESNRDQWKVVDNAMSFEQKKDEDTWLALWDELTEYQGSLQSQQRDMLRSFQDYSD